jgi:hypothetical protein
MLEGVSDAITMVSSAAFASQDTTAAAATTISLLCRTPPHPNVRAAK